MPCVPRTLCQRMRSTAIAHKLTPTKSACTAYGRPDLFCGGTAVADQSQLFVRALFLAKLPRTPTRLARARVVLTVQR